MKGSLTRRGKESWRLKFDLGRDPITGKRRTEYVTVRGTKRKAQTELTHRLNAMEEGGYVEASKVTLADYARHWIDNIAPASAAPKTMERYREIVEKHIVPQLGAIEVQKLEGANIDTFYQHLRIAGRCDGKGGLAPQTVMHIHRRLSAILKSAVKAKKLRANPMDAVQTTPKVRQQEAKVLDDNDLAKLFSYLKGRALYMPVMAAAATGMRRGEVLALRWRDIDLSKAELHVRQVAEQTKDDLRIKEPKTERSRRTIALPDRLVSELREHRKEQSAHRLRLGLGKDERDLVFPTWDGAMRSPRSFTKEFSREIAAAGLSHVTFHGLRHTHITHLLRNGVPVHVVSQRAGHANPTVTLNVYSHVMPGDQEGAAAVINAALQSALQE